MKLLFDVLLLLLVAFCFLDHVQQSQIVAF
jgi:hypothetical protein